MTLKKFFLTLVPIVTLVFFIAIMLSGYYLKKPRKPSEDVVKYIYSTMERVKGEDWEGAAKETENLNEAWSSIMPRIQFSVETDEVYNLTINIARLKGALMAKDKSSALMELTAAAENWRELTR